MVIFSSSALSVYFNQFFCLFYIKSFLILHHTKLHIEKILL